MLENIDLSRKISRDEYKSVIAGLEMELAALQRKTIALKIPSLIVFEGWKAAGKGTLINRLLLTLDQRHLSVFSFNLVSQEEMLRPFLWRFWIKTPPNGRLAIFDRSWYRRVLRDRVNKSVKKRLWSKAYQEINTFERHLTDDGTLIIKFFLHISKDKQKKRLKLLENNPSTAWRVKPEDWQEHRRYKEYWNAVEDMLARTDSEHAPWTVIEAEGRRFATIKIFQTVINRLKAAIAEAEQPARAPEKTASTPVNIVDVTSTVLDKVDLAQEISREEYSRQLRKYQNRMRDLEHEVYTRRLPVIILYEGWDAAGKGGNIRRLTRNMDPRGYDVISTQAPNDIEKRHHYLWRFWKEIPKAGHIAIFDRTWYGRVLVERIEGFCSEAEWKRANREINEMEAQLTNFGTIMVKFWLHIDQEEQLRRFEERQQNPHKSWKITEEDWRNRDKWELYRQAVDEMLLRTSSPYAPWTIVEAQSKLFARLKALKTVVTAIESRL